MTTKTDLDLKRLNRSGFVFQLAVEYEIRRTIDQHNWEVIGHEIPWKIDEEEKSGFADIVLRHRNFPTFRLVIECKKQADQDGRQLRWHFLQPDNPAKDQRRASCFEVSFYDVDGDSAKRTYLRTWDTVRHLPQSLESEFCVLSSDEPNRTPLLENWAANALDSVQGIAEEEIRVANKQERKPPLRLFVFPAIVTNAELHACEFLSSNVSLQTGSIPDDKVISSTVPFIRFRKSLHTGFAAQSVTDLASSSRAKERTTFVVNASSIVQFLQNWQVLQLDDFNGYAIQRIMPTE